MSIVWMVYFAGVAMDIAHLFAFFGVILIPITLALAAYQCDKNVPTRWGITSSLMVLCFTIASLIPSEKTIYMMCGASIAQDIANNPKTIATMDKVYKLIDSKLEEQLKNIDKKEK